MRIRAMVAALATALAASAANASFHFMQIEQVIGGVNGNTNVQAIQLRLRSAGQSFVSNARIRAWDAAGANPIMIIDMTTNVANGAAGARVLIATSNLPSFTTTGLTPDFVMTNPIPPAYMPAGSLTFEDNIGTVYWRLSWGGPAYVGTGAVNVTNDADGNANPPFPGQLPRCTTQAMQFRFAAGAASTNNANDYQITAGAAVLVKNNGQSGTATGPAVPTGACCTGTACGTASACSCGASGGAYQGDGTVCSPNPCLAPEACCFADGTCANLFATDCAALGGESQGAGSVCQGDLDGDGIDDTCQSTPCSDAGPAPHWVDSAHPGIDTIPTGALVGIDTDFDCVRDSNLVLFGPAGVRRTGAVDDSTGYPGTRPVDGHLDVIDTEMVAMTLSGGGATLIAGAGRGTIPLAASPGAIAEQPGDPTLADSFFDVFFEIDLGGGNRVYNQSPLRVQAAIDCIPPSGIYFHPIGICIPLYTSPTPGMGVHVANLVSANHDPFPQPGACCLPGGSCIETTSADCEFQGGDFRGEGSTCGTITCPPSCVPAGPDCWSTACGATKADFSDTPIPADFFDPGSQPFTGLVQLDGMGSADTVVQRLGQLCFPDPLPSSDVVPVELVQLNLVSCTPITVQGSGQWDVEVGLSGSQGIGMMTATKTSPAGGTFTSSFPVQPVYVFRRVINPSDTRVFDTGLEGFPPIVMETVGGANWSANPAFDFCSPGDGFGAGETQDDNGQPCCEETCHGTSGDPAPCDPSQGHCHCTMPPKCRECPQGAPSAVVISAVSRRGNPNPSTGGFCDTNLLPPRRSEMHQGGVQHVRIGFDVLPGAGSGNQGSGDVNLFSATCAGGGVFAPDPAGFIWDSTSGTLIVNFGPPLPNGRTYRLDIGGGITSAPGQQVLVRGLVGDSNGDGLANGLDRSTVVGAWTGPGSFSCNTDMDNNGTTNALDRSITVGAWTGAQNCAP